MMPDLSLLIPELVLISTFLLSLLMEVLRKPVKLSPERRPLEDAKKSMTFSFSFLGVLFTFLSLFALGARTGTAFGGMFLVDPLAVLFKFLFAFTTLMVILMAKEFFRSGLEHSEEFMLLLLCTLLGLFMLASSHDFLLLFISLEIVSLSFYILAAYLKRELASVEAGLKYLVLGSLASAFVIFGIALLYVAAGATSFSGVRDAFGSHPRHPLLLLGAFFTLAGFCFKVAAAPFQLWVPDVYEGAPTPVVAFLAVGSKAAGFAALLRILFSVFLPLEGERLALFSVLAAATLIYGNLGALVQTNIKRLFGYSSISHAGYLLIGLAVGQESGITALLYYLIAYAISNLAAFLVITIAGPVLESNQISAYRGLSKRSPLLAATLFVALLSLAGVPPLAGFFGKFLILMAAIQNGLGWLALLGALGVAVSLYYYLSVVRMMYLEESSVGEPIHLPTGIKFVMIFLILSILILGIWQAPWLEIISVAARSLF